MKVDVIIQGFNRPDSLGYLLNSLRQQEKSSLEVDSVQLFLDGPRDVNGDVELVSDCVKLFKDYFPRGRLHASQINLGPNGNCERTWKCAWQSHSDAVLMFEDDLELSPLYFQMMFDVLRFAAASRQVGMVSAHGMLGAPYERMEERASNLLPMAYMWGVHRWGIGMPRATCHRLAPIVLSYFAYAKSIGHRSDNQEKDGVRKAMINWLKYHSFYQDREMHGYDAAYDMAAYLTGCVHLNTYGVFARSTGINGTSSSEKKFRAKRYDKTKWLSMKPKTLNWLKDEKLGKLVSLVRIFHKSHWLRENCTIIGADWMLIPNSRLWYLKTLYRDFYEWDIDEDDIIAHRMMHLKQDKI